MNDPLHVASSPSCLNISGARRIQKKGVITMLNANANSVETKAHVYHFGDLTAAIEVIILAAVNIKAQKLS